MMNNTDKSSPSGDELLQELMPRLGLEATAPKERYKNQAWARYYVPRVLICCLAALAAAFLLLLPVRFTDVRLTETFDRAELEFQIERLPLFESLTATLDGRPLTVTTLDRGLYHVEADKNGELTLVARTFTGRSTELSLTVGCIDNEPPFVGEERLSGGYMYIYISDGDGANCSGVNWDSVRTMFVGGGKPVEGAEIDESAGYVRFPFPDASVRVYAEDNNGNPLSLRLDRPQTGG